MPAVKELAKALEAKSTGPPPVFNFTKGEEKTSLTTLRKSRSFAATIARKLSFRSKSFNHKVPPLAVASRFIRHPNRFPFPSTRQRSDDTASKHDFMVMRRVSIKGHARDGVVLNIVPAAERESGVGKFRVELEGSGRVVRCRLRELTVLADVTPNGKARIKSIPTKSPRINVRGGEKEGGEKVDEYELRARSLQESEQRAWGAPVARRPTSQARSQQDKHPVGPGDARDPLRPSGHLLLRAKADAAPLSFSLAVALAAAALVLAMSILASGAAGLLAHRMPSLHTPLGQPQGPGRRNPLPLYPNPQKHEPRREELPKEAEEPPLEPPRRKRRLGFL